MAAHNATMAPSFPPGYEDEYCGNILINTAIAFIVLETVFTILRYTAQRLIRKPFGIDDWLMIPAWLFCMGTNVCALVGMKQSLIGYHFAVVVQKNPEALIPWGKILFVTPILYSFACCFPKLVLLSLYLRIFTQKPYRVACYILAGLVIAIAIADVITGFVVCTPIAFMWDKTIPGGHCINIPIFYRWGTLPNAITDFFMLILPLPVVYNLQVPKTVKIGLTLTFLTGSVGIITSAMRCVAFFTHDPLEDGTWVSVIFIVWSIVEPGVYLIAACLPCYRPFLTYFTTGSFLTSPSRFARSSPTGGSYPPRFQQSKDTSSSVNSEAHELSHMPSHSSTRQSDEKNLVKNKVWVSTEYTVSSRYVSAPGGYGK